VYLKRLELLGFKSFPDKTIIKLTPGVTSIVGPNGCGKTNILDAIRWVLGEQKISLLRGSKMEEIIFNGTRDIKPLGMAEVTLVVQNNKGILPTEYSEVQVTRRLFRSGESEYLLNKVPCRLKDITDLFMDTGVGAHIYSVIQQDMIEAILSDRADDRRFLFEEAAGISKYKHRKKAALRKLEATEADLLRLRDIVSEVNSQVNSLNRQMHKTQRYQKLSDELKGWEIFLSKSAVNRLEGEHRELTAKRESLGDDKLKIDTEIDSLSARQEEERKILTDIDRQLSEISNQIYELSEAAHSTEKEITVLRERRDNDKQSVEKNVLDVEAFNKRKEILLNQIEQAEKEIADVTNQLNDLESEIADAERSQSAADENLLATRREREELHKKLVVLEGQLSAGKSDDVNLKEQESEILAELDAVESQHEEINQKKNIVLEKRTGLANEVSALETNTCRTESDRIALEDEIETLNNQYDEISGRIFDLTASLEAAEAREHLLTEMVTHYEGFSGGVAAAMENQQEWPGLIGTVADCLIPRRGFELPIEAALGESAGFMICRQWRTAEHIIEYLSREKKGRAGILILQHIEHNSKSKRPRIDSSGFVGWADDFISTPDELKALANLLLSRVAIAEPEAMTAVLDRLPPYFSVVTTDGKLVQGKTIISGGSQEGLSLLGRREKIEEQDRIIERLNAGIAELETSKNRVMSTIGSRQADLNRTVSELETLKEEAERAEKEMTELKFELQTSDAELARTEKEKRSLSSKLEILKSRQYSLNLNFDQLAREKEQLVKVNNELEARIETLEIESREAENRFSDLQIKQIELKSKRQQLESQINHTRELISEIESNASQRLEENEGLRNEIQEIDEKVIQLEKDLKDKFDGRTGTSEKQSQIREEYNQIQESLNAREKEIKDLRQSRDESGTKLHTAEIKIAEIESETRSIRRKMIEEYDIDLDEVTAEPPNKETPPEQRHDRMQELKERLKDFGAVNLLALEEYKSASERYTFLNAQMNDLLKAKSTLQTTITKINQTAKRLFHETFAKVDKNFRDVFEELFTGGEASIRLVDEDDPLESPIEINARPRGKKLLSITQMSGGERALTAISLLFAIYLVKPSPFCILDEIDAPLDDANIHRFLKLIKTFSDQTQFVIITHNKITMEAADILYGITMEQPGVSRVVSVRFNEEGSEKIIDSSLEESRPPDSDSIPKAVKERINPTVDLKFSEDYEK
jgi:chromosome segregation protein